MDLNVFQCGWLAFSLFFSFFILFFIFAFLYLTGNTQKLCFRNQVVLAEKLSQCIKKNFKCSKKWKSLHGTNRDGFIHVGGGTGH